MRVNVSKQEADEHDCDADAAASRRNDSAISTLTAKIASLQEVIVTLQGDAHHAEERVENATTGLQMMLSTAKDTIASLQSLIAQKNESIEQYKGTMNTLLRKLKEQQSKYAAHLQALKQKYHTDQQRSEQMMLSQLNGHADGAVEHAPDWVEVSSLQTALQEKENVIAKLQQRNEALSTEQQHREAALRILNTRVEEYHGVIEESKQQIQSLSDVLAAMKAKLISKKKGECASAARRPIDEGRYGEHSFTAA